MAAHVPQRAALGGLSSKTRKGRVSGLFYIRALASNEAETFPLVNQILKRIAHKFQKRKGLRLLETNLPAANAFDQSQCVVANPA